MAVNLAQKYSAKLDQVFTHGSYTDAFVNKNYDFDGVQTVNVYTVTTVAPTDYSRTSTGDRFGGNNELQDVVTSYKLDNDKSFKIVIDRGNYEQGALAKKAGEVMKAEMNEQVIPMIDKDRLAAAATGATAVSQAYTKTAGKAYDVKDADTRDNRQKDAEQQKSFEDTERRIASQLISSTKVKALRKLFIENGIAETKVLSLYKVNSLEEFTEAKYSNAVNNIDKIKSQCGA